ncbi:hypothetical protein [Sanguibacter sp. HDW7]|uniref:hypothetical protein n=1 Tax=Sanguibacter sp. HDW7 TaxID=2714931 RepID=UPI00140DA0F8|nr:hypothetical protein [Sanguibacter sp. HDW7]QIK84605.1 hypothetical protein G7063_14040 [Sanguibacter sp. HDW7]
MNGRSPDVTLPGLPDGGLPPSALGTLQRGLRGTVPSAEAAPGTSRTDDYRHTSVRPGADGAPPGCVVPYDDAIARPEPLPRGISVAGGVTDVAVDLDELASLTTTFRSLAVGLSGAVDQAASAGTDVDGLEGRLCTALAVASLQDAAASAWGDPSTARAEVVAGAADTQGALALLGTTLGMAADEAGRLADGLVGAREVYEEAEVNALPRGERPMWQRLVRMIPVVAGVSALSRAAGTAFDGTRDGAERADLATPALDIVTDLRAPLYPVEVAGRLLTGLPVEPLSRAGTADVLVRGVDELVAKPMTYLWTGKLREELPTPVMRAREVGSKPARAGSTAEALSTLDAINRTAPEGAVGVQRTLRRDGSSSWVVYVPGSEGAIKPFSKGFWAADHSRTWGGNTGALLGRNEQAIRAVEQSMKVAGVKDGEKVVFVGHSQGGAIGALLAAKRGSGGLVTVGAPAGGIDLPDEVEALHIEVEGDEVHELDGRDNPATLTRTTVTVRPDEAADGSLVPSDSLHSTGNGAAAAAALDGSRVTEAIDGVLADVGGRASGPLARSLAGPVTIYVPEPTGD